MNYLHTNRRTECIAMILILGVVVSLFIIPVLCGPIETSSLSAKKAQCPILTLGLTSDTLILSEDVTYLSNLKDFTLLGKYKDALNLPIVVSLEEKPPKTLA